jgi:hypothetical protein
MPRGSTDDYRAIEIKSTGEWRIYNTTKRRWASSTKTYATRAAADAAIAGLKARGRT